MGRKIGRICGWILAGIVLCLACIVVGVGLYTQTEVFRLWLKEQIVVALQPEVNGEITLERVSGSLWTKIQLHNASIRQNGVEVLTVPQVGATIHLLPQLYTFLWSGSVHIAALEVSAPAITVFQEHDGTWNVEHLFNISDEPQEPTIVFDRITIADGRVQIRRHTQEETHLTALSGEGTLALLRHGIHVNITNFNFSLTHPQLPHAQCRGGLSYDDATSPSVLQFHDVDMQTAHSQIRISGAVNDLSVPTVEIEVAVHRLAVTEVRTVFPTFPLQEDLTGTVQIRGPLSALQLHSTITAPHGQVTTSGTVNLSGTLPHYSGRLDIQQFALGKVFHIPHVAGDLRGQVSFSGTGLDPSQATLQANASGLLIHGWTIDSAELSGELSKGQVVLNAEAKGKTGHARLQSHVTLGHLPSYEATVTITDFDIARVTPDTPQLAGQVNLDAWVKGSGTTVNELDSTAKVRLRSSRIGPVAITKGEVGGTLHRGQLTLDQLTLLANETTLTAQGKIGKLQGKPDGKITYTLDAENLTPWFALVGVTGGGGVQLAGTLSGTLTDLHLEGKATATNLRFASSSLQNGTASWTLSGIGGEQPRGQVTTALTQLNAGAKLQTVTANLTLTGQHPLQVQATVNAQADDRHALDMKTVLRYDGQRFDANIQDLALSLPSGIWQSPQPAQFLLHDDTLTIANFQLRRADQLVSASGILARHGTQNLQVQVQRFPLAEIRSFLDDVPEVSGYLNTQISVSGTAVSPVIDANLAVDSLTVAGQSYAGLTAQGTYQQDFLRLNALLRQDTTHTLTFEGGIPLSISWAVERPRPVLGDANIRIYSNGLSLAFLHLLSKEVRDVQGTVSMDVRVNGAVDALVPSGEIRVQQGQVRVLPLGVVFRNIDVQLGLSRQAIQVSQLTVSAGKGQLTGSGTLTLQHYTVSAIDVTLNAERFRVTNIRGYTAAVSGQLTCSGSLQSPLVRGALTMQDTTLRPDLSVLTSGPVAPDPTVLVVQTEQELTERSHEAQQPPVRSTSFISLPQPQHELYQKLRLDLAVTIPRDTWVQMHDGSIELTGQLQIKKNPFENITLSGSIETVRGWYAFYGRQFQIERGQVLFTGGSTIDPSLDIVARYTLPKYKVDVIVGGTAETPTLTFQSDPSLEQADILSLLVFGKPANALNQQEKVSLQNQALQAAGSFIAADLRQSVAGRLGIDNLEVNVAEYQFGMGKYIAKDVYVSTSQQFGGTDEKKSVSIEYQLSPDWQFKATTDSQGISGIDLFWHKQY